MSCVWSSFLARLCAFPDRKACVRPCNRQNLYALIVKRLQRLKRRKQCKTPLELLSRHHFSFHSLTIAKSYRSFDGAFFLWSFCFSFLSCCLTQPTTVSSVTILARTQSDTLLWKVHFYPSFSDDCLAKRSHRDRNILIYVWYKKDTCSFISWSCNTRKATNLWWILCEEKRLLTLKSYISIISRSFAIPIFFIPAKKLMYQAMEW